MSNISASSVKDLRERTGAGMMDCKKALTETNGDFEAALDWLRAKGLSAAAKKAGNVTSEGLVAAMVDDKIGAAIEVNSQTDFVARNDIFQSFVSNVAKLSLRVDDLEALKAAKMPSGKNVSDEVVEHIATIGENISLRRMEKLFVNEGVIAHYVHNSIADNLGTIAVIVALESKGDKTKLLELGKQIAMHIAAARPVSLNVESVDPALLEREKAIFIEQSKDSGKPDNIIEKMVEGRIRKFYEESVLLEQIFVIDNKSKIREVIDALAKELGTSITLKEFVRFELGEGIEQQETDFAAEVAAVIGK